MKPKKKNRFFMFIFSFLPGASEMYMGFMKKGVSMLVIFFLSILIPVIAGANDIFILLPFFTVIYGFFHARNLAHMDEEDFLNVEDSYIWDEFNTDSGKPILEKLSRKWIAVILIILGICFLWNNCSNLILDLLPYELWESADMLLHAIPGIVVSIAIIILGIFLIRGKKKEMEVSDEQ